MKITYFGHAAFQFTLENGSTLLFDPYRNQLPGGDWFLHQFPPQAPDYVVITHPHFDHDEIGTLTNTPSIIRDPFALVEGDGFKLTSLLDKHAKGFGASFGAWNIIFVLESEGVRICHWGDNQPDLTAEQIQSLGEIDVLILPIEDGAHLLELPEVEQVIGYTNPKIIFPVHYHIDGLTNPDAGLTGIDDWLAAREGVKLINANNIQLSQPGLPVSTEVWAFSDACVVEAL